MDDILQIWSEQIERGAETSGQRTGQYLFNHLPSEAAAQVVGTMFDPFNKDLSIHEIRAWLDKHIIYHGNRIVGLFNGDMILWQKPAEDTTNQ